jgi:hypothetical protein
MLARITKKTYMTITPIATSHNGTAILPKTLICTGQISS